MNIVTVSTPYPLTTNVRLTELRDWLKINALDEFRLENYYYEDYALITVYSFKIERDAIIFKMKFG